jgi:hypothetical protein
MAYLQSESQRIRIIPVAEQRNLPLAVIQWMLEKKKTPEVARLEWGTYCYHLISVGERPNPGYELEVVEIGEERDEGAVITVRERWPLADRVYLQVVSYPSVLAEILGSVRVWLLQNGQRLPFE